MVAMFTFSFNYLKYLINTESLGKFSFLDLHLFSHFKIVPSNFESKVRVADCLLLPRIGEGGPFENWSHLQTTQGCSAMYLIQRVCTANFVI